MDVRRDVLRERGMDGDDRGVGSESGQHEWCTYMKL